MPSEFSKKIFIFFMLGLLTASAFFMRLENFKNKRLHSIDEVVYYRMGKQVLEQGFSGYHTIPYGQEMTARGRPLSEYFFQPLFKHPPVFTFFLSLSMKMFGKTFLSAGYVSLLFGALMIPLIYLLGALTFDRRVGILSAFFLWMDPVNIICSQKAWMESALSFFTVLSVFLFIYGLKKNKHIFFVISGCACGLAVLTKYTGILPIIAMIVYAGLYQKQLFRNKKFLIGLGMPFFLLLPWIGWNVRVYGMRFFPMQLELHPAVLTRFNPLYIFPIFAILGVLVVRRYLPTVKNVSLLPKSRWDLRYFIAAVFVYAVISPIIHSLQFSFIPPVGWGRGYEWRYGSFFYFGRLLEFSPIYFFSFISLFLYKSEKDPGAILRVSALVILFFFMFWKNYQSRYILPAIPFLLVLAAWSVLEVFGKSSTSESFLKRSIFRSGLVLFLIYAGTKTLLINKILSYPHDFCYF